MNTFLVCERYSKSIFAVNYNIADIVIRSEKYKCVFRCVLFRGELILPRLQMAISASSDFLNPHANPKTTYESEGRARSPIHPRRRLSRLRLRPYCPLLFWAWRTPPRLVSLFVACCSTLLPESTSFSFFNCWSFASNTDSLKILSFLSFFRDLTSL